MFREYAIEVKDHLLPPGRQNTLVVVFSSPLRFMRAAKLPPNDPGSAKHKSLRKCHCDFGSYIGAAPHSVRVGVYRDVVLDLPDQAWIEDVCIRPRLSPDLRSANVHVRAETAGDKATLRWVLIDPSGREADSGECAASGDAGFEIPVREPQLWWPRMHGKQNLYTLDVSLHAGERVLDRRRTTFGFREVRAVLSDPATGEKRFRFDINGRPVFLRGGDWVPVEGATHVWQPQRAAQLLDLAEHGNMNMLRIWGEGELPPQWFYDECDRRGICIWQDFMFGYYDHREGDTEFLDNCRAEIEQTIRRAAKSSLHPALGGRQRAVPLVIRHGCPKYQAGGIREDHAGCLPASGPNAVVSHQFPLRGIDRQLAVGG
jgi:beta-mannosidase